jgi:hypothetical protein
MYNNVVISIWTSDGDTNDFPINIELHQGSALSPYLFALVMDEVTRDIQGGIPWCMLFVDDVVLVDESRMGVDQKLELWRWTLEAKGFRLSRSKTEYMKCDFSATTQEEGNVRLDGLVVPKKDIFRYLGSMLQKNGDIDKDVCHRIKAGWWKWHQASGVLCDSRVSLKQKGKIYRTAIWPTMLYGAECWPTKRRHVQQLSVAEMRMLRWIYGHIRRDRIRSDDILDRLGVAPVEEKLVQHRLRWFGHMQWRPTEAPIRNGVIRQTGNKKRGRGRPNLIWEKFVKRDLNDWCITNELTLDSREWKLAIHVPEDWSSVPSFYCILSSFLPCPFFAFLTYVLLCFLLFLIWFFYHPLFSPSFLLLLLRSCFVPALFFTHVVSSLAYPNLLGNKRLGCCCKLFTMFL